MKKLFSIILLILLLCSCGKEPLLPQQEISGNGAESSVSEQEQENRTEDEKTAEEELQEELKDYGIPYPYGVPEELFDSAAFKEAISLPSLILYKSEPISDNYAVTEFLEANENGENAELHVFYFIEYSDGLKRTLATHIISENGITTKTLDIWEEWENKRSYTNVNTVKNIYINSYDFLTIEEEEYEPEYFKVVSDFEIFENVIENREILEKYLDPIYILAINKNEYKTFTDIGSDFQLVFEELYYREKGDYPWKSADDSVPLDDAVELMSRYFEGVTREKIIEMADYQYDYATDSIFYGGGIGGLFPYIRVFESVREDDILTVCYELIYEFDGCISDEYYVMKIRLIEDGTFRYISKEVIY